MLKALKFARVENRHLFIQHEPIIAIFTSSTMNFFRKKNSRNFKWVFRNFSLDVVEWKLGKRFKKKCCTVKDPTSKIISGALDQLLIKSE